ncbi:MAG TPA: MerR family transcriptional regulator [Anaerolineae bacterium]|nr:MerR family transcriptional regulator [Anaerolineae bacterium]HNU02542.1 MerR family transcriptional regulator [Anaerolineae bacterium]
MSLEGNQSSLAGSDEPIYNIGVVSRMTGIPVATLRVWERRYEFPSAGRTAGGHRLYSEQELMRLRWVKATIDQGMQTSQAIRSLRSYERQGRIPEIGAPAAEPAAPRQVRDGSLDAYRQRLAGALVRGDLDRADQILVEIMAIRPLEQVISDLISPALAAIGEEWRAGRAHVAAEHLASAFLRQRLTMWLAAGPPVHPIRPLVLACAPNEWHEMGLLMLAVLLRRRRWPLAYLGQATPLPDLARFVRESRPPAVVVTATTEETGQSLLSLPRWLPEIHQNGRPFIAFGGRAFSLNAELRAAMPGVYLGATLSEGVEAVERLLRDTAALTL